MRRELVEIVEGMLCHLDQLLRILSGGRSFNGDAQRKYWLADLVAGSAWGLQWSRKDSRIPFPQPSLSYPATEVPPCRLLLSSTILGGL